MGNKLKEKVEHKFQKLVEEGNVILRSSGWNGQEYHHHPSDQDYQRWRTEALNLVKRVCGDTSEHYLQLKKFTEDKDTKTNSYYFKDCFGVLEAAYNDYKDDFLFDVKTFVRAELLDDLLSQAEYLLSEGYHIPAASLAGAILEDTLRKLCDIRDIAYAEKTKIDTLNNELAKTGLYDKLIQKEITAKADIRNNADHGHFDKFNKDDVEAMIKWVRRFCTDYLKS
jgi:hypothetical protein